ncbi:SHOCT domain-containing protein [Bacillus sp. HMF5848]|uniref:SHOCT domain-containing protein n=1 Tax=Bacillus sp. HMF5848 TaxID=2495421 RepID=UPI000F7B2B73|nr:SHOCT domain-containing protein [Bacillus sp. HMF5848]RSK26673.1 SHOCT domain-containing protein [Bacillus sp. HMF5848]
MMNWMDYCSGIQGGGWMMGAMFVFWTLLLVTGFYLLRSFTGKTNKHNSYENILKMRLASGEISEEEYDRLKNKLK